MAVATFSFDASACVVWIDRFPDSGNGAGLLCARHADSLTPRWDACPATWACKASRRISRRFKRLFAMPVG